MLCGVFFVVFSLVDCLLFRHFLFEPYASTEALVTRVEPQDHAQVYYSYQVGGRAFSGNKSYGIVEPGAYLRVYYLLSDPAVSSLRDPPPELPGILLTSFGTAVFVASGLTFFAFARSRMSPSTSQNT